MATRVVPLESSHQAKKFDCENADLNFFLQATAAQHQRKFLSKTYVLIDDHAAAAFYRRYGFTPFPDDPLTLLIPFAEIPR